MATKKPQKKDTNQLAMKLPINDERVIKLFGLLFLFFGFYLLIAFTSYLFTWHIDYDKVSRLTFGELVSQNLQVANWLGRLGAVVSYFFFYWLFGLPSYIFVILLGILGRDLIQRTPLKEMLPALRTGLLLLVFFSVFLGFVFQNSEFPWGGTVGKSISMWMKGFVGTAGMILLFLFLGVGLIVWFTNPNFANMTPRKAVKDIQYWFENTLFGRGKIVPVAAETVKNEPEKPAPKPKTLRPGERKGDQASQNGKPSEKSAQQPATKDDKEQQLAFELEDVKKRREQQKIKSSGDAQLEIEKAGVGPGAGAPPLNPTLSIEQQDKNHTEPYDPTLELSSYEHPVLALLQDYDDQRVEIDRTELEANKDQIIETLLNYKIEITKIRATIGPTVTLYEIVPAPGVRISKIKNLEDDIALSLAALGIRIIAPIPGRGTIGIEVPNKKKQIVSLKEVLMSEKFKRAKMNLPIALGKTISNEVFVVDLTKMPHLLIAGATGQGKSVGINTIIMSLIYKKHPSQVKIVMIDPKKVELFPYARLDRHFLAVLPGQEEPITTETNRVIHILNSLCIEMDQRYDLLKKASARNIREYNDKFIQRRLNPEKGHRFLPFIVLIVDEFADLIMTAGKEVELPIGRLAQLARAVGIHLIIATQRPSVNIITGVIKANFPARIAFKVTSKIDSRTILDAGGAEQLIGRGDQLLSVDGEMIRLARVHL